MRHYQLNNLPEQTGCVSWVGCPLHQCTGYHSYISYMKVKFRTIVFHEPFKIPTLHISYNFQQTGDIGLHHVAEKFP